MKRRLTAVITKGEKYYVAKCIELEVVSQGLTIEKAKINLKEAVELYLESFGDKDIPVNNSEVILSHLDISTIG